MDSRYPNNGHGHQHLQPGHERHHQRFSWQTAVPEEEAPPYEPPQQPLPHIETAQTSHNRAFSYAQTPIELRDPYHSSSLSHPPLPGASVQASAPIQPAETRPISPPSPASPHDDGHAPSFSADSIPTHTRADPQTNHARKLSYLSPLDTNLRPHNAPPVPMIPQTHQTEADPLPYKTPISPISAGPIINDGNLSQHQNNRKSFPAEPYSPHGFPTTPSHAVFSPHAAHGPNGLDFALHQPGQIAHPNMDIAQKGSTHEFKHSLCECTSDIGTCLTGLFCPCVLYGRTSYRLSRKSDKKDPTDMLGYKAVNGHCLLMSVSCGLWWLFPMLQRTRIRHLYKVKGGLGSDILKGCCCCCCVAIQNEREVRGREESSRRWAGPASAEVYTAPAQMKYAPQN
ncbi:PLAC8-domain-containing protein [Westerdykella ornata]|uniref:PLAC8-domain-containing protein n=1 Tax=Westerdykella ornata TaxID=318751 RepID=A0A6A6JKD8_WESOR|nr:PLAC8-domain-containing protein [Westerdykella ornata]KAF2276428.1 PLAC8-domain-containing protein [Westerdykella ornata]